MYCRNCGNEMPNDAVMCVKCGVAAGKGNTYCPHCKGETQPGAEVCVHCGRSLKSTMVNGEGKDWLTTLLLCFFLGGLGIHRFYTKHIGIGILQLLTLGCCGIFSLIDLIMIAIGNFKDADGNPLVKH